MADSNPQLQQNEETSLSGTTSPKVEWKESWSTRLRTKLEEGAAPIDAFIMLTSNQMSQLLLLLPYCISQLGWWKGTLGTVIFGFLSCWTAYLVQFFYFRCIREPSHHDKNAIFQWDELLRGGFVPRRGLKNFGMFGLGFNCLCLLARSVIQLTYSVSILYFVYDKLKKRNWIFAWASCCLFLAFIPTFRNYRILSSLSLVMATIAAVYIAVASLLHPPVQRVKHSGGSNNIQFLTWVWSTIVYAFGGTAASVETLTIIESWHKRRQFNYAFLLSMVYALVFSLLAALSSYAAFGDELSKIPPVARPSALALLPPSRLRNTAAIFMLIHQLVAIGYSLYPHFVLMERAIRFLPHCQDYPGKNCYFWRGMARVPVLILVCILAAAFPFSGSIEITSLIGSLIVSTAIYIIPTATHMCYFGYSQNRQGVELSTFWLITSYMMSTIVFMGVLILIVIIGGCTYSIKSVFFSHHFHRSDLWNKCYLCADSQPSSALAPLGAPAPT